MMDSDQDLDEQGHDGKNRKNVNNETKMVN